MFELYRREEGGKAILCSAQNAALFVDLSNNIFWFSIIIIRLFKQQTIYLMIIM